MTAYRVRRIFSGFIIPAQAGIRTPPHKPAHHPVSAAACSNQQSVTKRFRRKIPVRRTVIPDKSTQLSPAKSVKIRADKK
ncbi:hypothetical protein [Neisseria sp.]|uniref:hypothetical protein n=1 Tax=Neisseria sp. TaxID=192066 RepID=UPI0035A12CA1